MSKDGLFTRFYNFFKFRANKWLDRNETPIDKMDKQIMGMDKWLSKQKAVVVEAIAQVTLLEREREEAFALMEKYYVAAQTAKSRMDEAESNNDDAAYQKNYALAEKTYAMFKEQEALVQSYDNSIQQQKEVATNLKMKHEEMRQKADTLRHERDHWAHRAKIAESNRAMAELTQEIEAPNSSLDLAKKEIMKAEAEASAHDNLNALESSMNRDLEDLIAESSNREIAEGFNNFLEGKDTRLVTSKAIESGSDK